MASTAADGFSQFLTRLTPSQSERDKAASHRQTIYDKLDSEFGLFRMFESGSFKHGTGVSGHSDVDYFVSLKSDRPVLSSSTLASVREALQKRFPSTYIHAARPAVVLGFGSGYERVEIIPAFAESKANGADMRFRIPGVRSEWIWATPEAHLAYVNEVNKRADIKGGAKGLARLAKAWKYYRNVPISSFYLEMRAAAYMRAQKSVIYAYDLCFFLRSLDGLAAMNDPTGNAGRIEPCSSDATLKDAQSKLTTAISRAEKALEFYKAEKTANAFEEWDLLFAGEFPAFY